MPDKDLQKEEIIKKYNLDDAKSNWKVSPSKFTTLVSNLPTNFKLLTEFMLGKNKPININDFTKDELVSIITLAEKQEENKLNVKNRKLKGQPENITTVSGYDLKGRTKTFPDWVENNSYFTAMANSLSSPDYQVRTSLGKYDVEETPSSLIVKDAYDMNIKQRDLPKIGDRKNLSKILDYMRVDPEMAGEFISNIIKPNPEDSRKFDLVIPKRKPDQPSPRDTAYQAPMQLKEKPKDNPRIKEEVPEGFDILKFDKGGDVAAQMDLMLPKKGMSYGELILDNVLGLDNEYESFGEKLGKAINKDEVGFLKDASVGAYEGAKEFITSPVQTTKKVFSEIKDSVQRLGSENLNTRLNNMYGVSYADATDDQVNSAKEAVFGDAITALSLVPAAKATVSVAKAGIKNTNINKVMTLGETEGSTFKGKLNLVHGFNPPTDAPNLVPTFTTSEKYGGERYGELDGAETPGGSYGTTGVYLENPSDPLFFNSPEMQGFYAPKTAQVSAQFNKAFILRPNTLKELEQITGINLKDSLPKIEDGNLKEKNYLAEEQGALVSAKLKELGYDGLIVKDFFLGDKEIDVYDKYEPLRKKIETKYKEKFGKPIPEKGTKEYQEIINLYNKQNKELEKIYSQAGIHPLLTQPQIIHLKPETLSTEKVFPESLQSNPNQVSDLQGTQPIQGERTPGYLERALNKLPEYDPNTLGSMGGNINLKAKAANSPDEPKIISFTKKKEDKELENFNANLMSSISEQASKQAKLVGELQEAGVYGDYQKGVRVQSQNYKGEALPPYTITGLSLNKVKLNNPNLKRTEDRLGIKFEYIEKDGDYYLPMLSVEQADGGKSQVYLDALKQRNTPIMDGPKDFNKGGAVMNEQMEMAFMQQGGLKDDGMKRDPVSGNEVPNGSMAKEVRDDIPAQLSEGEYVVPADVVRYLGVKHFEDLRDKAKNGLQKMEATGRIGGDPVPVGGPKTMQPPMPQAPTPYSPPPAPMPPQPRQMAMGGDLTPAEMQEINNIMMNQGGMVAGAANGADFSFYKPPEGVSVEEAITTPGRPGGGRYTGEFSFEQPPAPIATVPAPPPVVVETPATCEARGMVYNPETKLCEMPAPTPRVGGDGSSKDEDEGEDSTTWMDSYDYTDFNNLAQQTSAALDGPTTMLGSAAEFIFGGGVLGKFAKASNAAQVAANIAILEAQGKNVDALKVKFNNYVNSNDLGGLKNFITGSQLAKQINTTQVDAGLFKDSTDVFGNKIFKTDKDWEKQLEKNAPEGMTYDPTVTTPVDHDDDDGTPPVIVTGGYTRSGSAAPSSSPRPEGGFAAAKAAAKAASNKDPGPSGAEVATAAAKKSSPSPSYAKPSQDPYAEKRPSSSSKPSNTGSYGNDKADDYNDDSSGVYKGGLMKKKRKK